MEACCSSSATQRSNAWIGTRRPSHLLNHQIKSSARHTLFCSPVEHVQSFCMTYVVTQHPGLQMLAPGSQQRERIQAGASAIGGLVRVLWAWRGRLVPRARTRRMVLCICHGAVWDRLRNRVEALPCRWKQSQKPPRQCKKHQKQGQGLTRENILSISITSLGAAAIHLELRAPPPRHELPHRREVAGRAKTPTILTK